MSNARSPREVCSTTMGTSGLIVLASLSRRRRDSSRRLASRSLIRRGPQTAQPAGLRPGGGGRALAGRWLAGGLVGRPQPPFGLRARDRDRPRLGGDQVERAARGQILARLLQPARRPQVGEHAVGLDTLLLGRGRERLRQLLVAGVDRLGLDDRREHGLAPQRLLGFGLQPAEDLGLLATRYAQVGLARDTPVREAVEHALPHFLRARAGQLRGDRDARLLDDRVQGRLAELALDALLVDLEQPPAEIPAQLLDAVVAGIDGEVLV